MPNPKQPAIPGHRESDFTVKKTTQASEGLQKIADLAADIGVAMVTTLDVSSQTLTSRPMMPLDMDEKASLWFFTSNAMCHGLALDRVNVSFAEPKNASYVSFAGRAVVVGDRARIRALWTPMAKPWFPKGEDDPTLVLLRVDCEAAEYWDSNSSKVVRMLSLATATITGEPLPMGNHQHVKNPAVAGQHS